MDYEQATAFLDSLVNYEREMPRTYDTRAFDLENFARLLGRLGSPQEAYPIIHVAGTKGKGSVVAMLAAAFAAAGRRAGAFTSPHLRSVRERLAVDEELISPAEFGRYVGRAREAMTGEESANYRTYFETLLAAALLFFREREVDVALLETGLGGRLDATNVVSPAVVALTSIGLDHTNILGTTLAEIAAEKAGVLKEGVVAVSAPQEAEAAAVLAETASRLGAPLAVVGADLHLALNGDGTFDYRGPRYDLALLKPAMLGPAQRLNAAVALAALEQFEPFEVPAEAARKGVATGRARGRAELLPGSPALLLDSAHTAASARELAAVVKSLPYRRKVLLWGMSYEKDAASVARELAPCVEEALATAASLPRARAADELAEIGQGIFQTSAAATPAAA
ncbi:MAG: bifunctional folylpolyglutamate synthase/dihydrofolate synthase, partial [Candidatus Coatesbacteria bacterium]